MENKEFRNEDFTDSKYYKFGLFYFNKEDKRIFPPKRIKAMGWTVNFANPISIMAIIAVIGLVYVLMGLFKKLF